ncbi:MAG: M73 family metallopeptidase [Clostridiales Family XIII bacterium]|jgi:hypothetical protein|nr:M73 family metallopeptidase [Clostridiales Family XIII bacterium]
MSNDAITRDGVPEFVEQQEEKRGRKKLLIILLCLILSIGMIFGVMFAFFSDMVTGTKSITSGTLDIKEESVVIKHNGVAVTSGSIANFNPGDVVTVSVTVKNYGNKSAWLRGGFTLSGTAVIDGSVVDINNFPTYFKVFEGTVSKDDAPTAGAGMTGTKGSDSYKFLPADSVQPKFVINGNSSLAGAEVEQNGTGSGKVPVNTTIVDDTEGATITYTIYFDKSAGNAYQGKILSVEYLVQAMQYRNNSGPDWTDVVTTPFTFA